MTNQPLVVGDSVRWMDEDVPIDGLWLVYDISKETYDNLYLTNPLYQRMPDFINLLKMKGYRVEWKPFQKPDPDAAIWAAMDEYVELHRSPYKTVLDGRFSLPELEAIVRRLQRINAKSIDE